MKEESLIEAYNVMIEALLKSDKIDKVDAMEILLNEKHFLDPKKYKKNIKVLQLNQGSKFERDE